MLTSAVVFFDTLFFAALTPLLPHYAHALSLGKTGAGVLAAAYPAGAFVGAIPSGIVAARAGVKPTVLVGLSAVAACTVLFGVARRAVAARHGALRPGPRERVLVDGRPRRGSSLASPPRRAAAP